MKSNEAVTQYVKRERKDVVRQEYRIVADVPVLRPHKIYPFAQMQVNDSFYEPDSTRIHTLRVAATYFKRKTGMQFMVRQLKDGGARCWRVK